MTDKDLLLRRSIQYQRHRLSPVRGERKDAREVIGLPVLGLELAVGVWFPHDKCKKPNKRSQEIFFRALNPQPVQQLIQQCLDDPLPRDDPTLGVELNRADR